MVSSAADLPLAPRCGCRVGDDGIGYLSAHPVSVSVKGPCHEHESNLESMFNGVGDDILINEDESDIESDTSGEPEGLTDSSSEDETVAQEGM